MNISENSYFVSDSFCIFDSHLVWIGQYMKALSGVVIVSNINMSLLVTYEN